MSMSATVSNGFIQREGKALDLPMIGAAPKSRASVNSQAPIKSDDPHVGELVILGLVERALDRTMPRKEAAFTMGIDQAQLSRQLDGDGHLSLRRLGRLGEPFWRNLIAEASVEFGVLDRAALVQQGEALIDRGRQLLAQAASR